MGSGWRNDDECNEIQSTCHLFRASVGRDYAIDWVLAPLIANYRFYGKSRPTPDLSLENLKYLSSHQALADIAFFKEYIVDQFKLTEDNRWIAFGGSYSGALAAWLRIKYPNVVHGSVATSAPVQAEFDFYQYLEVVGHSLEQANNGRFLCEPPPPTLPRPSPNFPKQELCVWRLLKLPCRKW